MSCGSHTMKVYPPKSSSGAKASDRLQEYLTQSNPCDMIIPDMRFTSSEGAARGHRAVDGSLASVEAALIDNHVHAPHLPSHSALDSLSSNVLSFPSSSQLPTKDRWKKFCLDVLTCIPQRDHDQACEGFLEAMKEIMLLPPVRESSAPGVHPSCDRSSINPQNLSWSQEHAPSLCSALFDESRLEQEIMPRLEELLHALRSPR
jgi:hypothetical protein